MAAIFAALLVALQNPALLSALISAAPELITIVVYVLAYIEKQTANHADPSIAAIGGAAAGTRLAMEAAAKAASDAAASPNSDAGFDSGVFRKDGQP